MMRVGPRPEYIPAKPSVRKICVRAGTVEDGIVDETRGGARVDMPKRGDGGHSHTSEDTAGETAATEDLIALIKLVLATSTAP